VKKCHLLFSHKLYWLCTALLGIVLLVVALYYQHVLGEEPCQVCIHIRIWVAGFIILSSFMLALPSGKVFSVVGHGINTVLMAGLWERCLFLLNVENGHATSSCNFFLGFPDWFALDKWFPEIFEVRNLCSFTPELLFGISMAQCLIALASVLVVTSLAALIAALLNVKSKQ
jgi:protein dithiol:quinone oxidoreductase